MTKPRFDVTDAVVRRQWDVLVHQLSLVIHKLCQWVDQRQFLILVEFLDHRLKPLGMPNVVITYPSKVLGLVTLYLREFESPAPRSNHPGTTLILMEHDPRIRLCYILDYIC